MLLKLENRIFRNLLLSMNWMKSNIYSCIKVPNRLCHTYIFSKTARINKKHKKSVTFSTFTLWRALVSYANKGILCFNIYELKLLCDIFIAEFVTANPLLRKNWLIVLFQIVGCYLCFKFDGHLCIILKSNQICSTCVFQQVSSNHGRHHQRIKDYKS